MLLQLRLQRLTTVPGPQAPRPRPAWRGSNDKSGGSGSGSGRSLGTGRRWGWGGVEERQLPQWEAVHRLGLRRCVAVGDDKTARGAAPTPPTLCYRCCFLLPVLPNNHVPLYGCTAVPAAPLPPRRCCRRHPGAPPPSPPPPPRPRAQRPTAYAQKRSAINRRQHGRQWVWAGCGYIFGWVWGGA